MKDVLLFKFSKKETRAGLVSSLVVNTWLIFYIVFVDEDLSFWKYILIVFSLIVLGKEIIAFIWFKKENSLLINNDEIVDYGKSLSLAWKDVKSIEYIIKSTSSFIAVKLKKNEKLFISEQKWIKLPRFYYNNWRFKTPFVINLEIIEGETDVNFKKIEEFVKENNLLQKP